MPRLEAIIPPAGAATYLVNLAVAVTLVCGVGYLAARTCRHGSAPLRHGVLLGTLVLILLSPAAVWLAQQNDRALVRVTIAVPPDARGALIADELVARRFDDSTGEIDGQVRGRSSAAGLVASDGRRGRFALGDWHSCRAATARLGLHGIGPVLSPARSAA